MPATSAQATSEVAAMRERIAGTERVCVVTGEVKPVDGMIRFVAGPDHTVVPDVKRRLPGRGVWVTATREALELAIKGKCFERSFKRQLSVPRDLADLAERLLQGAALDALAISHKAGKTVIGFGRVEAALARGKAVVVLRAIEASPEGAKKLDGAFRSGAARPAIVKTFTSAQLDLALGRSNVIHAALLAGSETETFLARVARLDRFRTRAMAGGPAIAKYGLRASTKAAGRSVSMIDGCGKPKMAELDRDGNG